MKKFVLAAALAFGVCSIAYAQTRKYNGTDASNFTRACSFPNAPMAQITTSGSSQSTGVLKGQTVYRVLCATAAYMAQGASPTAAATSLRIVADTELYVLAQNALDKLAFRYVASAGICEVTECQ